MIRYLTAGESHGEALIGIVEGVPAGLELTAEYINRQLARRWQGFGRGGRAKFEEDLVHIYSGVRFSRTMGSPIAFRLDNAAYLKDRSGWPEVMAVDGSGEGVEPVTLPRPGHADLTGAQKYGFDDIRPVIDRASARETAMRVACCSVARRLLAEFGIFVGSHVVRIGEVGWGSASEYASQVEELIAVQGADGGSVAAGAGAEHSHGQTPRSAAGAERVAAAAAGAERVAAAAGAERVAAAADRSEVRMLDANLSGRCIDHIKEVKADGDSLGGVYEVIVTGVPVGLGSYVQWDRRLDGQLAQAIMSIQGQKAVEIGDGVAAAGLRGSNVHDEICAVGGANSGAAPHGTASHGMAPGSASHSVASGAGSGAASSGAPTRAKTGSSGASTGAYPRATNRAGGIEGGMSNGMPIIVRGYMKPIPTLIKPLGTVDMASGQAQPTRYERSDVTSVPAASTVAEAVVAHVIANALLEKFGSDSIDELRAAIGR